MSDYSNTFGGAAKDAANSTILGTDFDTEFDGIATMSATKANKTGAPATTNNLAMLTSTGDLADSLVESDGSGNITANVTGNLTGNVVATSVTADTLTATTTNGDLAMARNGTGDITIDTVPIYGMVVLDTPQALVNSSAASGSWTQMDMSVQYAAAATAGATKAIIKVVGSTTSASATSIQDNTYIRLRGSGLAADVSTRVTTATAQRASAGSLTCEDASMTVVNLDSNSDFDWYHSYTGTNGTIIIYLIGYYV